VPAYKLTPKARGGLRRILAHVHDHFGARVAEEVLDRLVAAFELVAEHPLAGHRREDLTEDERIRFWSVGPTLIAYRLGSQDVVEILLVERGERDWERLLAEEVS
jgi:plasmid stabilization system protein ParE